MRLVTGQEMREVDARAIKEYGIPGIVLMENAGLRVVEELEREFSPLTGRRVCVFAGPGNNGGDGFVIARHLLCRGIWTKVFLVGKRERIRGDALVNLNILEKMGASITVLAERNDNRVQVALALCDIIVDALLGTGSSGPPRGPFPKVMEAIKGSSRPVVAVDIPSGLDPDTGKVADCCLKAQLTVTFGLPKRGLCLLPGAEYAGRLVVADIGLPPDLLQGGGTRLITKEYVASILPQRPPSSHKGTFGHLLLLAGSRGFAGAAVLAARGALRSGAGLVSLAVPGEIVSLVAPQVPEAMVHERTSVDDLLERATAVVLGPGLGTSPDAKRLVRDLMGKIELPLVIDADGLNILAEEGLELAAKKKVVLTPHPGEMARLSGLSIADIQADRVEIARAFAKRWSLTLVLKGARTVVAGPDGTVFVNPTGNPGMATGGTGDVLAGMIGSLLAQGLSPMEASAAAVFLHGLAGDRGALQVGQAGLVAGDVVEYLPTAWQEALIT
ncbi:MAG: NAD(P)H-hydrate dehydratase [Firmicutes bacterium]|nr:NAD(P)H-hydrate dehydratase [Bacillota bacterium]